MKASYWRALLVARSRKSNLLNLLYLTTQFKFLPTRITCLAVLDEIRIYHNDYTAPITIWANICKVPIIQIEWSTVYNSGNEDLQVGGRFLNRLCEFFVIDQKEDFHIWNLSKDMDKPVKIMAFSTKHDSSNNAHLP